MRDWTGEQIGNYQVIRLLEQETLIDHYLAFDMSSQREVALDILASPTDEMSIRRFQRNVPILQHLLHPSIVPFLDAGAQGMTPFVVLDHLPTSREIHQFPLPLTTVIHYVSPLTEAFDFVHRKGIVHRSLSPDAIFIGKQGEALLGDLHLSLLRITSQERVDNPFLPSPAYGAPEQFVGDHVDASTDQYALALVVYEWLCGMPPFQGVTPLEIALQHIQASPPPLREKAPMLPLEIEHVIEKALAKLPKERFATIKAFCTALVDASQKPLDGPIQLP